MSEDHMTLEFITLKQYKVLQSDPFHTTVQEKKLYLSIMLVTDVCLKNSRRAFFTLVYNFFFSFEAWNEVVLSKLVIVLVNFFSEPIFQQKLNTKLQAKILGADSTNF